MPVDGGVEGLEDERAHLSCADWFRIAAADQVGGAVAGGENFLNRGFDGIGFGRHVSTVAEQHGSGEDGAEWVGEAFAGDVGG